MRTIAIRLRPGADLKRELVALAARERVQASLVLTCVGSLSQDGGHLHLAVADQQGRSLGGHLAEGCAVRTTAEVVLGADDRLVFAREHDSATGYEELVVRERDDL